MLEQMSNRSRNKSVKKFHKNLPSQIVTFLGDDAQAGELGKVSIQGDSFATPQVNRV